MTVAVGCPQYYPNGPIAIRDGTVTRLQALTTNGGPLTNVFAQRTIPTKDDQIPFAAVWHAGERTEPNGDNNVGAPSFLHTLTLAVDVVASGASETALDANIVNLVEVIRNTLLTDGTWVQLFEGIDRIDARYNYPKETDLIVAEAVLEFDVTYRSEWPPYEPNAFEQMDVNVQPNGATSPEFTAQFELEQ